MTLLKFCSGLYGATGVTSPEFCSSIYGATGVTSLRCCSSFFMERLGWPRSNFVLVLGSDWGDLAPFRPSFLRSDWGWPRSNLLRCCSSFFYGAIGVTSLKFCSSIYGATGVTSPRGWPRSNFVLVFMERLGWRDRGLPGRWFNPHYNRCFQCGNSGHFARNCPGRFS